MIEQLLRHGKITVNNKKAVASNRLIAGDSILIPESLKALKAQKQHFLTFAPTTIKLAKKIINEYLIFENEHILAINKPAKLATQGGTKINLSINDAINFLNSKHNLTLKLVHKLDKETSGVLLIAKNHLSASKLTAAFKDKVLTKQYITVVANRSLKIHGTISSLLAKNKDCSFAMMTENKENGKLATTLYKVVRQLNNLALIEFVPLTGRTHQLRVHAHALKCPIIGDKKYKNDSIALKSKYMLLHAHFIKLPKEIFGFEITIKAPIPLYFNKFIDTLYLCLS